mmetsp:Transcript_16555/g.23609  ORF Transcript_16555/g.23609 Transcript_16555/m.23609 type:complete len:81 (+) Transcript_16555:53-295(+)
MTFYEGDSVMITGGTHNGKTCVFIKYNKRRASVWIKDIGIRNISILILQPSYGENINQDCFNAMMMYYNFNRNNRAQPDT